MATNRPHNHPAHRRTVHPTPIPSTSETEPLLPRESPPPRYSSIEPSWEVPLDNPGHTDNLASAHVPRAPQIPVACPGWWSWVPGPAQMFPPGLEHLANVQSLHIRRKGRRYCVWRAGEVIYTVRRMKDAGGMILYRVQNNANLDVLLLNFTKETEGLCSPPVMHAEVSFPPGNVMGVVQGSVYEFTAHNPSGDLLFLLHRENPTCFKKPGYVVETREMQPLGKIERVRIPGCCTSRRVMEVSFPGDLDLRWKALLLAGAIIIRYESW
ncbi:uncharacterized protein LOC123520869 [Portunus trituberculatus]|uniref:uncharacterized protein LOC123520869 n=1 Tax=Portunus trituberculatus TaxID=210409 RepID=UPI001E1CFE2A|nr:uncharacterized protein LOC123520869 [Portunus trituberculatus]XP_045139452.1 uncharacterized protein LOC123520869 [Portunus trituberculatus]